MKLKNQVCTLGQAKKLKELGIEQNSLFSYVQEKTPLNPNMVLYGYPQESMPIDIIFGKKSILSGSNVFFEYSAFNESELAVMLDAYYETYRTYYDRWQCHRLVGITHTNGFLTPCEASAATLIYLLENDESLTVNACNVRLNNN